MTHDFAGSPLSGTPLIFDGGLGTRLADRGNDVTGVLWSAEILRNDPDEVQRAHEDFYRAAADVATTCSYQVTFDALGNEAEELLRPIIDHPRDGRADKVGKHSAQGTCLGNGVAGADEET